MSNLALVDLDEGHSAAAMERLQESLAIDEERGDTWGVAADRTNLVGALVQAGRMEEAYRDLRAVVRGHLAGIDDFFAPDVARALEAKLRGLGKDVELTVHEGAGHAFMNPDNSIGNLDEALAAKCWAEATAFLHDQLG